ncbi:hypothetical protein BGZ94_006684 [Podila epigama]|nr:hypothetical protein BGZ94_006684 [Podila epigama]
MKFTLSVAVLALAASQAVAVVPIPIKECTKKVMVLPTDTGCDAFAAANGCTFADLLKWNDKLRTDCLNLDVGHPLCVSVTPGAGDANTTVPVVPKPTGAPSTSVPIVPTSAPAVVAPSAPGGKPAATSSAAAGAPNGASSSSATSPSTTSTVPNVAKQSSATSTKASMLLGAAGLIMSAVYIL